MLMNKILTLTRNEFDNLIRKKRVLGTGSEGVVYDLNNGFALKHLKDPIITELQINADTNYDSKDLLKFAETKSKCYYFPIQIIYVDNEIEAHISRKCNGYNLSLLNANTINLNELNNSILEFQNDTLLISNKGIKGYDMRYNFIYDGKSFGAVDTTFYDYSSDEIKEIYKTNISCFNDEVSSLLIEENLMHFVNQNQTLLMLYNAIKNEELLDLIPFINELKNSLSSYVDKDITYLSDAKKAFRKNNNKKYPNTPLFSLIKN